MAMWDLSFGQNNLFVTAAVPRHTTRHRSGSPSLDNESSHVEGVPGSTC
jgi:hypothetical protein